MIQFSIPGEPVGKGRPKFARRGAFVRAYTPEKTASFENLVKLAAAGAMNGAQPRQEALQCEIVAGLMVPASWSQKKRMAAISGETWPTKKPDADNVAKAVLDACNGIVFVDDAQVVVLTVRKVWTTTPQTVVRISGAEKIYSNI